jgi:DNA polymerase-3 subunit beta
MLAQELRLLNKIVPGKPALAILSHVLLRADQGLHLYATDLEIGLSAECRAVINVPGEVALPAARLLALVEQFRDGDVNILLSGQQVAVQCGSHTSRLLAMPVRDFPMPPEVSGEACKINADAVRTLIEKTRCVIAPAASKIIFQGALLLLKDKTAAMVATDGKRLAMATMSREGIDQRVIVPTKTLDVLADLARDGELEITFGKNHLFFHIRGRQIVSRTIDGEYPKYEGIIPRNNDKVLTFDRSAFAAAMRRVLLVTEDTKAVYLSVNGNGVVELSAASAEVGSSSESLPVGYKGPAMKVCVNGEHMLDFLNSALHPTISVSLKDAVSPALLTDGADHIGVVMLMRTA